MNDIELREDAVVDLGQASFETKGPAIFGTDGSGGKLRYVMGIADD
jgi:hypothetical protein